MVIKDLAVFGLAACVVSLMACGGDSSSGGVSSANDGGESSSRFEFSEPNNNQIRPGVLVQASGSQCTSNFLFALNDETVYLGVAAHCFSLDTNAGIDPCETANLAIGFDQVIVENASQPAELAYSSWSAMQQAGEQPGSNACQFNDFALVKLHPDDIANIHPAVFSVGGPISLFSGVASVGDPVLIYGRSSATLDADPLVVRQGEIVDVLGNGWSYDLLLDGLVAPGDSGGPVLTGDGRALAVINTFGLVFGTGNLLSPPVRGGAVNLDMALQYAKDNGFIQPGVSLLTWADFTRPLL